MIKRLLAIILMVVSLHGNSQVQKVFTADIDNFWIAYDSIQSTTDSLKQLALLQTLYIDKGTEGLTAFMKARNYTAPLWIKLIRAYPKFWNSIRPNTLAVKTKTAAIEKSIETFKLLYPQLKPARMYFTIGCLNSGGTVWGDRVLIGAEIATADAGTDVSQFTNNWLRSVFKDQKLENIIALNIHEYVHTQQKKASNHNLLSMAIHEGACDFIAELVMGAPMPNNYMKYGRANEKALKEKFKQFMYSAYSNDWIYNGSSAEVADLGYFMGYTICKSYYDNATDKKKAIQEIIELEFTPESIDTFLSKSRYYKEPLDKNSLLQNLEAKRPAVLRIEPLGSDSLIDASVKEMKIVFSQPMNPRSMSIAYSARGKEFWPGQKVSDDYSANNTTITLFIDVKPGQEYEFMLTDKSFRSAEGYPLLPYTVRFRTKGK